MLLAPETDSVGLLVLLPNLCCWSDPLLPNLNCLLGIVVLLGVLFSSSLSHSDRLEDFSRNKFQSGSISSQILWEGQGPKKPIGLVWFVYHGNKAAENCVTKRSVTKTFHHQSALETVNIKTEKKQIYISKFLLFFQKILHGTTNGTI